jgi:hypothetical protein
METFHLYHLAKNYVPTSLHPMDNVRPPAASEPVSLTLESATGSSRPIVPNQGMLSPPRIRAAAAQMIFAARLSKAFITPEEVIELERWSGRGVLEALIGIDLPAEVGQPSLSSALFTQSLIGEPKHPKALSRRGGERLGIEVKRRVAGETDKRIDSGAYGAKCQNLAPLHQEGAIQVTS